MNRKAQDKLKLKKECGLWLNLCDGLDKARDKLKLKTKRVQMDWALLAHSVPATSSFIILFIQMSIEISISN